MTKALLSLLKITVFTTVIAFSTFSATAQVLDGLVQTASRTPTLAYSLRKLRAAYAGPAVRVRNAAGAELRDVYFDSNGLVSLNSTVSAAGGGVATATTLTSWIGSGTCFITTWYDQSRDDNTRNATNPAAVQSVSTASLTTNGTSVTLSTTYNRTSGATTTSSTALTLTDVSGISTGVAISGTGITAGTSITAINTTTKTLTLSAVASVPASTTVTINNSISFTSYDFNTNSATTNNTLTVTTAPATSVVKMAITGTGITDGTFAQGTGTTITTTKAVNVANGAAFKAYATGNTYQPGNMLVASDGTLIGIIKSIESSTSLTLIAAAPTNKTYLTSEWGLATQPTLVKDGVIEFIPGTSMPAMRVYNGTNSNTRFKVPNYINDAVGGASINLAGVQNVNLFTVARVEGNFGVTNGQVLFGTYSASPTASKLIFMYGFSSTFAGYYRSYSSTAISSPNSPPGVVSTVGRLKITSDGTNANTIGSMYNSANATAPTPVAAVLPAIIDATQIQLLGQNNGFGNRNFEGLASELIFYGSTSTSATKWDETDAVALYNNESLAFVNGPTVIDPTVTSVAATSATIGANVAAAGASVVTACGTYYGTAVNPVGNGATASGTTGTFTRNITGLTSNTKYYYRGYATNTAGTNYSVDGSFTTLPAMPTADAPSDISSTGFTAHWTAPVQGAETYTYRFHYTTSAAWSGGTSTPGIASSDVSRVISGLTPNTMYYYRLRAENTTGGGMYSNPGQSLTTLPAAPTIAAASSVTASGFTANWTAPTQGAETFTYTVEYGTAADLSGATAVDGITSANLNNAITGLAANTLYYFRVKAVNAQGAGAWSDIQPATTLPAAPTIAAASAVTASGFTANWTVPTQGAETFTYTVEYGTASDLAGATAVVGITSANLNNVITALTASTNYYYRVKAVNTQGAGAWSAIQSVTTAAPTVISTAVNASDLSLADGGVVSVQNNGHLTLNQPTNLYSITVEAGGKLTNTSTLNATNIILKNTATGSATYMDNGTTNLTSANVQQELANGRNWYVSSPVSAATVSSVNGSTGSTMVYYDEVHGTSNPWPSVSGTLTPGKGYIALSPVGAQPVNVQLNGTLNNGDMPPVSLTRTSGQTKEGFNLVGNPYPSYIIWTEAIATASNVLTTIWYRTKAAGSYTFYTYNPVVDLSSPSTEGLTSYIPPLQAFWVRVKTTDGGTMTFSNNMRAHADVNVNLLKVRSSAKTGQKVLRLQVSNGQNNDETVIVFHPQASDAFDNYDSPKMSNGNAAIPEIYTVVGNEKLVINGLNSINSTSEIPLGFYTGTNNTFTIKATELRNFDSATKVLLKDKLLNVENELTLDSSYQFSSDIVNSTSRFSLIFRSAGGVNKIESLSDNESVLIYVNANNNIVVKSLCMLRGETGITVSNLLGQELLKKQLTDTNTILNESFPTGIYLVTFINAGRNITKKVIVN